MPKGIGVGIWWGLQNTSAGSTLSGSLKFQNAEYSKTCEKATVEDSNGNTIQVTYFNQIEECLFESVPTTTSGLSASFKAPDWGDQVTMTSDIAQLAGTWYVEEPKVKYSNKESAKFTCKLVKYPSIS